jgi:hypothetical protein
MKIVKLEIKDLLPKKKKNPKNGTWHTEKSYSELLQKKKELEKRLEEAEFCLDLIEVHTGSIGQSKKDMNESLIAIMNICRKYFDGGDGLKKINVVKFVEYKGKVK